MYISRIVINNIRSIEDIEWKIYMHQAPGWHVIIGDNGTGKSTFVRAVALALVGPTEAVALRQDWDDWLKKGEEEGFVRLTLDGDADYDVFAGSGARPKRYYLNAGYFLEKDEEGVVSLLKPRYRFDPERHVWGGKSGWFSASFGPFRRFAGGDKDFERIFYSLRDVNTPQLAALPYLS